MAKNKQEPQVVEPTQEVVAEEVVDIALQGLTEEELAKEELVEDLVEETEDMGGDVETNEKEEVETPVEVETNEKEEVETPVEEVVEAPKSKEVDAKVEPVRQVQSRVMRAGFVF